MRRVYAASSLVLSDVLLALLIWEAALVLQSFWGRGPILETAAVTVVPSTVAWIGMRAFLGLYPGYGLDQVEELRRQTYAVLATAAITAVFATVFQFGDLLSRLLLVSGFLGLLLLAPFARHLTKEAVHKAGAWGKPVVVLGSGEAGSRFIDTMRRKWELGYNPVAIFDCRLTPAEGPSQHDAHRQALAEAASLARKQGVDTLVFAMPHTRREQLATLVNWAGLNFRHVLITPNLGGITNSAVVARNLGGTFAVEIKHNLLNPWALRTKRAIDLGATIIGGLLILPLLLALLLVVCFGSPGPVFYRDRRMGRDGKLFSCLKFRTMVPDAEALLWSVLKEDAEAREEYLKYHKLRNDPRVTPVGRFLRKTSLDELPQLWNVLKGEMSLVGPRPYLPRESREIGTSQGEILRVPPGITGLWQVDGRSNASFDERVEMDAYYVRDWSVWLDVVLLTRTVKSVLRGRGAY